MVQDLTADCLHETSYTDRLVKNILQELWILLFCQSFSVAIKGKRTLNKPEHFSLRIQKSIPKNSHKVDNNYSVNVPGERAVTVLEGEALLCSEHTEAFQLAPHVNGKWDREYTPIQTR